MEADGINARKSSTRIKRIIFQSKEALHRVDAKSWPLILDADDLPSGKRKNHLELPERKSSDVCYLVSILIIEPKITVLMDR